MHPHAHPPHVHPLTRSLSSSFTSPIAAAAASRCIDARMRASPSFKPIPRQTLLPHSPCNCALASASQQTYPSPPYAKPFPKTLSQNP
eukprot:4493406-Pleurochrysis_carterae.AAC.1